MKNRLYVSVFALAHLISVVALSTTARADTDQCEYVPNALSNTVKLPGGSEDSGLTAKVHQVWIDGCKPQCVGRIFCMNAFRAKHPNDKRALKDIPVTEKIGEEVSHMVNCDISPTLNRKYPRCHSADVCMQNAKQNPAAHIAHMVTPNASALDHVTITDPETKTTQDFEAQYGMDRANPDPKIAVYQFPTHGGASGGECKVCASKVSLNEGTWGYTFCASAGSGCSGANECAASNEAATQRNPKQNFVLALLKTEAQTEEVVPASSSPAAPAKKPGAAHALPPH